jgi:ATP-dependent Clp protease ATP-binding subunit ClpA
MFERFTSRAGHAVVLAQLEARRLGHNYIGTEHLLLALAREPDTVAGEALASADITLEAARQRVLHTVGEGWSTHNGHVPVTPGAKRALERSFREASRLGDNYVGTGHLLLSLLRDPHSVAAKVVVAMGADVGAFERLVRTSRIQNRERLLMDGPVQGRKARTLTPAAAGVKQAVLALTSAEPVRSYHYLLALFDDASSVAAKVLASLDIDRVTVEQRITEIGTAGTTDELLQD